MLLLLKLKDTYLKSLYNVLFNEIKSCLQHKFITHNYVKQYQHSLIKSLVLHSVSTNNLMKYVCTKILVQIIWFVNMTSWDIQMCKSIMSSKLSKKCVNKYLKNKHVVFIWYWFFPCAFEFSTKMSFIHKHCYSDWHPKFYIIMSTIHFPYYFFFHQIYQVTTAALSSKKVLPPQNHSAAISSLLF